MCRAEVRMLLAPCGNGADSELRHPPAVAASKLGVLSAAEDRDLPTKLLLPALALYAAAPAEVLLIPNDSQALVIGQYVLAAVLIAAGSAAFGASQLVSKLQK